ncbi:3-oxoacyl-[acyl-carrier-protein] synthase-3 [Spinactinospora alkalitolerans]|uniref:3-oxoacyl-[acyl-carrier-protein] synthase-3 n=1 Tax=Spinactinospora alkalitolerans TaxID=687207 RepID=A0A852U6U3_9ACTN|nr:3-oxoacyl-[acyl-carrier-protein] synthase III C-terminal domain-containing protein [Spinactinospora alkalitolerans]NYE50593.1 3-oxoacyl-[acyl-carrier-protein] synthase-3 [Spinactinospora alkalitolerans]
MTGTATLERVESFLPERRVDIGDLAERLGLRTTEIGVFRKIYGLGELRFDPDMDLFDLVMPAARQALAALPEGRRIDYVVFAHTMQTVAPPDTDAAQVIRDELGLRGAEAFALNQQACVSSMGAIDVVAELMRADIGTGSRSRPGYALMVTGERAYSPRIQLIPHSAIMAEAAAACLITLDGPGDAVVSYVDRTHGEFAAGLEMGSEEIQRFGQVYAPEFADVIRQAVAEAGLGLSDIDRIIPHNVNLISWRQVIKELKIDPELVFLDNVPRLSHCYSSDVFVNYTTLRDEGRLVEGRNYVLASVGLGATFGAMVLTHSGK